MLMVRRYTIPEGATAPAAPEAVANTSGAREAHA
jgi:hypothetical protein